MPKVQGERYSNNQVRSAPVTGAKLNVPAPIEAFGGGQATAGFDRIEKATDVLTDIALQAKVEGDQLANKSFKNAFDDFHVSQYMPGKEGQPGGAFTSKGLDAFTEAPDRLKKSFDEKRDQILALAQNDEQRAFVMSQYNNTWEQMNKQMFVHAQSQKDEYNKQQTAASVKLNDDLAVEAFRDPNAFRKAILSQINSLTTYGTSQGMPPEQIQQLAQKQVSETSTNVFSRYIANNDVEGAKAFYERNKALFHGDDIAKTEKLLKAGTQSNDAIKKSIEIVKQFNEVGPALEEARNTISDPETLEKAETRIRVMMKEKNATSQAASDAVALRAVQEIDSKGEPNPATVASLPSETQRALQDYALHKNGLKPVASDNQTYFKYTSMTMAEMSRVSQADMILKVKTNTTPEQYQALTEKWNDARDGLNGSPTAKARFDAKESDHKDMVRVLKNVGALDDSDTSSTIEKDANKRKIVMGFQEQVTGEINAIMTRNGGKSISEQERLDVYKKVANRTITVPTWGGWGQKEVPVSTILDPSKVLLTSSEEAQMINAAKQNGIIPPNMSNQTAAQKLKLNMQKAKLYGIKNGPYDDDRKRKKLIDILRNGE